MAERYSKVLSRQNIQLFAGGVLLASTASYAWLKPRMERTTELQQRLRQVKQNMYWSMSLIQRTHLMAEESLCRQRQQQQEEDEEENRRNLKRLVENANTWWNSRLADFAVWVVEPGYTTNQTRLALTAAKHDAAHVWTTTKHAFAEASAKTVQDARIIVQWNDAMDRIQQIWHEEKSKWSLAHMKAIEAVHPLYEHQHKLELEQKKTTSSRSRWHQN